jgi:hypothetical protein
MVGLAAALLVLTSVGGYFYHRQRLWGVAEEHLRLLLSGPSTLEAGIAAEYLVSTTTIDGQPLPAQVEVVLSVPDGKRLKAYRESADERGRLRVVIPADLPLPPEIKLKVAAAHRESREEVEMPLRVEPVRCVTQLTSDKPVYQPGETIYYRSLTLSRFGRVADRPLSLHFEILDPGGAIVPRSPLDGVTQRGVGSGVFSVPKELADGQYMLVVRSPDQAFPPQKQPLVVRRHPVPQVKKDAIAPGKVRVKFFPEGGTLVAGLENRVYFVARNSQNEPISLSGAMIAKEHDSASRDEEVGAIQTTFRGMGTFSFVPQTGETYRLKITSPKGVTDEPKLPAVSPDVDLVLATGAGVFAAEKPLEFNIRAAKTGMPLVVAAYCRGVQVGQQPLVTKAGVNPVAITLDPAVAGVIWLTVYNYNASPPRAMAERLVYRRPAHRLQVAVTGRHKRHAPGEKVELSVAVTNEKGQPAPATLGVAVVDNALMSAADSHVASLPTYFFLTSEIKQPEDLEGADFYLSDLSKDDVSAAVALDLLLGAQAAPRLAERSLPDAAQAGRGDGNLGRPVASAAGEPPLMFDNLNQIRSRYGESLAEYRASQTNMLNTVTIASFFGGLGLVLLVAMLGLMHIVSGIHFWVPAVGAITSSLILGAILLDSSRLANSQDTAVAFSTYHAPIPKAGKADSQIPPQRDAAAAAKGQADPLPVRPDAHQYVAGKPGGRADMAETLFWNPLLIAGPDGKASIRFELSDVKTTFRVMIDAHGDSRIGAGQAEIVVQSPVADR